MRVLSHSLNPASIISSPSFSINTASYDSVSLGVSAQDADDGDIEFKPDGKKMYYLGYAANKVYQYTLTTAWDLSTASYDSVASSAFTEDSGMLSLRFRPDGKKLYLVGFVNDTVYQYSLSTAWDLSTISYDSVSLTLQGTEANNIHISEDGLRMYHTDWGSDAIYQYSFTTAWDLSTASYASKSFATSGFSDNIQGVIIHPNGTKAYISYYDAIVAPWDSTIRQYSLTTPWDISTASYDSISLDLSSQAEKMRGFRFDPYGTKIYALGMDGDGTNDTVYQYSCGSYKKLKLFNSGRRILNKRNAGLSRNINMQEETIEHL